MLSTSAIQELVKYASREKKEVRDYKKKPNKRNKKKLIEAVKSEEKNHPLHIQGGYYKDTKTLLDRADELTDRGNTVRGALTKYIGVPVSAVAETILSPVRAIGRAVSPNTNLAFSDAEDLHKIDDPEKLTRAANELLRLYKEERPDPTGNWEGVKKLVKSVKATPAELASDVVAHAATGGVPVLGDAVTDVLSVPHTALFDKMNWNGISREEYLRRKRKRNRN